MIKVGVVLMFVSQSMLCFKAHYPVCCLTIHVGSDGTMSPLPTHAHPGTVKLNGAPKIGCSH